MTIYHWFSKNTQIIYQKQIKALMIKEGEIGELGNTIEMVVLTDSMNINDNNESKIINIFTHSYILKGFNRQQSAQQLQDELISFVGDPDKVTDIRAKQRLDKFELGAWARVLVCFGFVYFLAIFYVDMNVLTAWHLGEMPMTLPRIGFLLISCITCYVLFENHRKYKQPTQNKYYTLIASLVIGAVWGWLLGSSYKSFIHWQNEQTANSQTVVCDMLLDDYDKVRNEQRWEIQSDDCPIKDRRLYFYGSRERLINPNLKEGQTYKIPVNLGKYGDIFIQPEEFQNQ
ncbi:hypothetical protein [Psychrobacter sp. I-STPA6b]|uniref:hypothetical protein n=1 Tax=Psychrobacter sp. I-STPA6b TaxID=2585718 RepID=UPI001D0C7C7E|nr:hypothetical protein [Psychrobacter sp. I-STPA6b]